MKKVLLTGDCEGRNFTRFTIKISLRSMINPRYPHAEAFHAILQDAIDRFNRIGFDGMKLAIFHITRLVEAGKELPEFNATFFRRCFCAVSRLKPNAPNPTSMKKKDPELAASFDAYRRALGDDATFAHREGLSRAIEHAVNDEMANLQN